MFENGYLAWRVRREYNRDRVREAERDRLVRQALAARRPRGRLAGRARRWLGRRMVEWGAHLQEQHAPLQGA